MRHLAPLALLAALSAASETASPDKPVAVHVLRVSGGGWGTTAKVRAALGSLDGIERFFTGGDRAVYTVKRGAKVSREAVEAALKAKRMKLETFAEEERARPKHAYVLKLEGAGWAESAGKVREALLKLPGVLDAFPGPETVVHASDALDEAALRKSVASGGARPKEVRRDRQQLWPPPPEPEETRPESGAPPDGAR